MDITPFKLADEAFWASTDRGADRLATELVGQYQGLLIDAPRRIAIDQRSSFPMAVYQLGRIRDVSTVGFKSFGLVTAMNVTENRLYVANGRAFEKDDDLIVAPASDPSHLPEGQMSATDALELRQAMALPWKPARYLLTALLRDQVSNRAAVELCQSPACFNDPEVARYLEAERARLNPPAVSPRVGEPLPSYKRAGDSLALPDEPGLQLSVTRISDQRLLQPWLLRGAFRVTPTPQEWVKAGWSDPESVPRGEPRPVAVIAVWLLMVGADDGSAQVFSLNVPSWDRADGHCTGQFAIDLRQLRAAPRRPQTYFVYAFSGASMVGPFPSALVGAR